MEISRLAPRNTSRTILDADTFRAGSKLPVAHKRTVGQRIARIDNEQSLALSEVSRRELLDEYLDAVPRHLR